MQDSRFWKISWWQVIMRELHSEMQDVRQCMRSVIRWELHSMCLTEKRTTQSLPE